MVRNSTRVMMVLALASLAGGCPDSTAVCARNSDCEAGNYCSGGTCISDCTPATEGVDCASGESCNTFGMCVAPPDAGSRDAGGPREAGPDTAPFDAGLPCVVAGGTDADGDGYCATGADADCNDADDAVSPGADEVCTATNAALADRAIDEDCDAGIDEGCPWYFGTPHPVFIREETAGNWGMESPRLRGDGLRLYVRGGQTAPEPRGVLVASRATLEAQFDVPERVAGLASVTPYVSSIGLSADELETYMQVPTADGAMDLFRSTRATPTAPFGPATRVTELNDALNDYHPFLRSDGLELLFVSARGGTPRLFRATRATVSAPVWSAPEELTLGGTPFALGEASPALSADGRTLFFARDVGPGRTLFAARRATSSVGVFDTPVELVGINVAGAGTLFPEVSEATAEIYFVSNRAWSIGGAEGIWRARICRDAACPIEPIACPSTLRSPDGLHCYSLNPAAATWGTAFSSCGTGHLATVHSAAENALLVLTVGGSRAWIGGYDGAPGIAGLPPIPECSGPGCSFAWVTGEPWTYSSWGPAEPNNIGAFGPENAVEMDALRWNDAETSATLAALCETEMWPTW